MRSRIKNFVLFMKLRECFVKVKPSWTSTECATNSIVNLPIKRKRSQRLISLSRNSCPTNNLLVISNPEAWNHRRKYRQLLVKRLMHLRNPIWNSKPLLTTHELLILSPPVLLLNLHWGKPVQVDSSTQVQPVNSP